MTYSMSSLKQECQRVMEIIMRNHSFHDKQEFKQHNLSQINFPTQIHINLHNQSKAFLLFYFDPITGHHWTNNVINQLCNHDGIHSIQLMHLLLQDSNANDETKIKKEEGTIQLNSITREYNFFNGIPSQTFLISSLEQICKGTVLFVVRSFKGQIIHLSIHPSCTQKISIIMRFTEKFPSRTLHVLIDSIDYESVHNTEISEQRLKYFCKQTDFIYLKRETIQSATSGQDDYVPYKIFYNSLLENYTQSPYFEYLQTVMIPLVQKILPYIFALFRQEIPLLLSSYYDQLALIKAVIQLNYIRGLQKDFTDLNVLQHFSSFIHSEIYIISQLQANLFTEVALHFPKKMSFPQPCCYCKIQKKMKKPTQYTCSGCQIQSQIIFPLCPQCLEPFHDIKDKLKNGQIINFVLQEDEKVSIEEKKMVSQPQQKNQNKQETNLPKDEKLMDKTSKKRMSRKIGKIKRPLRRKKKLRLTCEQLEKIKKIQESSQKIMALFKDLKNYKLFYKPIKENPKNQAQFRVELKNESDFMKAIDVQLKRQIQAFEGEVLIEVHEQMKHDKKAKIQKQLSSLLKIQHQDESPQQLHNIKIEEGSQENEESQSKINEQVSGNNQSMIKML